jgi:hypothetical protein
MAKMKYSPDGINIVEVDAKNADTVGGKSAGNLAGNLLVLDVNGRVPLINIPSTLTSKDAATVDGAHAGTGANNVLKLDGNGKVPLANIPDTLTGKIADMLDGYHAGNGAWNVLLLDAAGKVPIGNIPVPSIIPTGVIVMWSGTVASIPAGWALCNGTNGTPDLRDRFIVGAGNTYTPGNTGGAVNKTTSQPKEATSHVDGPSVYDVAVSYHTHDVDVRPPYYALAYIMKL